MDRNRNNPLLKRYLRKLERQFKHLTYVDRNDISKEIEQHIIERWESDSNGTFDDSSLQGVLAKMGAPEFIAGEYCVQRGWARPPKRHTLRNAVLITLGSIVMMCAAASYLGIRYIILPVKNIFTGSVVEVDDSGVKVLNDAITINNEGVKIKGLVNITDDDMSAASNIKGDFEININEGAPLIAENGNLDVNATDLNGASLNLKNGRITIKGTDSDDVKISYTKKIFGDDNEAAVKFSKDADIKAERSGKSLIVTDSNARSIELPSGISHVSYIVDVVLPKRFAVSIGAKNSNMDISSIEGALSIDGKNGDIDASDIGSNTMVDVKNGRISLKNIKGNVTVIGKNGKTYISDVSGDVKIDNKNGASQIQNVEGDIDINSRNGRIDVKQPESYGFKLSGEAKHVDCDFPTRHDGNSFAASVGDAKHSLKIVSKNGSVSINRK